MNNKRAVFLVVFFVGGMAAVLATPFLLAYSPSKINDYAYRQLSLSRIADYVTEKESDNTGMFLKIFNFVDFNQTVNISGIVANISPYENLVRGIGWCGQQDLLLMSLLDKKGIVARGQDVQKHSVTEVLLENRWRLVDTTMGALYYNGKGELASQEEILSDYGVSVFSEVMEAYNFYQVPWYPRKPADLYIPDPINFKPDGQSPVFRDLRQKNQPPRFIVDSLMSFGLQVYGSSYADWYQDRYLEKRSELEDPGKDWYAGYTQRYQPNNKAYTAHVKARNLHLHQRYEMALKNYDKVVTHFPDSMWADESKFFKGQLFFELKRYEDAIKLLSKIADNTKKKRSAHAAHIIGLAFENLGDADEAKKFHWQAIAENYSLFADVLDLYRLEHPQDFVEKLDRHKTL